MTGVSPTPSNETDPSEELSPEFRARLLHVVERSLRVRREIMNLAAFASGHRREPRLTRCQACSEVWPCRSVLAAAAPALEAFAECGP